MRTALAILLTSVRVFAASGDIDPTFDPGSTLDGTVTALAAQVDGKWIIGGKFRRVHGAFRGNVARLNANGTTDEAFMNGQAGANDEVHCVAVQNDGKILIGGRFSTVNEVKVPYLARLNPDGTFDHTFNLGADEISNYVQCIAIQSDGKILIGGNFTRVSERARARLARLNQDGTLDVSFGEGQEIADLPVYAIAVQEDGKILAGGNLFTVNRRVQRGFVRLNDDGSVDQVFANNSEGADDRVTAIAIQKDGRIILGGWFSRVNSVSRQGTARLNSDGTIDDSFTGVGNHDVHSLALQADDKVLVAGSGLLRQNADGTIDTTFRQGLDGGVYRDAVCVAVTSQDRVIAGGYFESIDGIPIKGIARLDSNGSVDPTFANGPAGPNGGVNAIAKQQDGKIIIAGGFTSVNSEARNRIARLNENGTLDPTFGTGLTGANNEIYATVIDRSGRIVIGGTFSDVNGQGRYGVARLNVDGTLDLEFKGYAGYLSRVAAIELQSDGKILVAGTFRSLGGATRNSIGRLNGDGSLDFEFRPNADGANGSVRSVALQSDGKILIGGEFTAFDGIARGRLARLDTNGRLDEQFGRELEGANNFIDSIAVQPDGKILLGGAFTVLHGVQLNYLARLNADGSLDPTFRKLEGGPNGPITCVVVRSNGRIFVSGSFTLFDGSPRNYFAALESDGSLDRGFAHDAPGADSMISVAVDAGSRILLGGTFNSINGMVLASVARLIADPPHPQVTLTAQKLGGSIVLSWPATISGFLLETSADLWASNSWTAVPHDPVMIGSTNVLEEAASSKARYYRLKNDN